MTGRKWNSEVNSVSSTKRVVLKQNDKYLNLTVGIADEKRQAMAYNMLYYMAENEGQVSIDGKTIPLEKDMLYLNGEDEGKFFSGMHSTKPELDPEWFGANAHRYVGGQPLHFVTLNDIMPAPFMPETVNYEKANEMFNFMHMGMDPSVSISCPKNGEMDLIIQNGRPSKTGNVGIADERGFVVTEHFNRNWAVEEAPDLTYDKMTLARSPKYEILKDDAKKFDGLSHTEYYQSETTYSSVDPVRTAYRIRALRDFGDVKMGDLGGYVESEKNLSHEGNCWIYDEAVACCDAVVKDDAVMRNEARAGQSAVISGDAELFGDARIKGYAEVTDHARAGWKWDGIQNAEGYKNGDTTVIQGCSKVSGHAQVLGEVVVDDHAVIRGNASVEGKWPTIPADKYKAYYIGCVSDNAVIEGNAKVTNAYVERNAHIHEDALVSGHPKMSGHATIGGNAEIGGHAQILHNAEVNGNAKIRGDAVIPDKVKIGYDADIREAGDILALKAIGKNSFAFHNQDDGITVVHKGKVYDGIEDFRQAFANSGDIAMEGAIEAMTEHFDRQMAEGLEAGLESIGNMEHGMGGQAL